MFLADDIVERQPPHFTTEAGWSFWVDPFLTSEARKKLGEEYTVWIAKSKEGEMTRALSRGEEWLYESTSFEAIACHIDVLCTARKRQGEEKE